MLVLEWARWLIEGSTCLDQFPRDDCKTGTFREQKTVERNPAVWPSRHWQVLPCQGGGHRGKQLHLLLGEQQWPGQQVVGRVREVGEEPVRDGSRAQAQHYLHRWGEPWIIFSHNALQYPQKMRLVLCIGWICSTRLTPCAAPDLTTSRSLRGESRRSSSCKCRCDRSQYLHRLSLKIITRCEMSMWSPDTRSFQGVGNDTDGILVLGATNIPWQLDAAIRRR